MMFKKTIWNTVEKRKINNMASIRQLPWSPCPFIPHTIDAAGSTSTRLNNVPRSRKTCSGDCSWNCHYVRRPPEGLTFQHSYRKEFDTANLGFLGCRRDLKSRTMRVFLNFADVIFRLPFPNKNVWIWHFAFFKRIQLRRSQHQLR